jgi:rhodanese-related sulfurtransferase
MAIRTITPNEVQAVIASGKPVDLIDVRTGMEFASVHATAARHVPLSSLDPAAVMRQRAAGADDPVYIICASGMRSASAAQAFIDAGFSNVYSVAGGTSAWAAAGLPVIRGKVGSIVRQVAIIGAVLAVVLWLMPCSPWCLWRSTCPISPPSAATP